MLLFADKSACHAGQGGNDLLGNRKQVADQELVRGNIALVSAHHLPSSYVDLMAGLNMIQAVHSSRVRNALCSLMVLRMLVAWETAAYFA